MSISFVGSSLLRDYQVSILESLRSKVICEERILVQLVTGGGKTVILSNFIKFLLEEDLLWRLGCDNIIIVAHRDFLVEQIYDKLYAWTGKRASVYLGGVKTSGNISVLITTVQTLSRRMLNKPESYRDYLLIIDECHHSSASSYGLLLERSKKVIGFTATPTRMDNKTHLGLLFNHWIQGPKFSWMVEQGYLSSPYEICKKLMNDSVRITQGDYDLEALYLMNNQVESYEGIYNLYEYACGIAKKQLRTIVYAVNVKHAMDIKEHFSGKGIRSQFIDSKTPKEKRRMILEAFSRGDIKVLCNVEIFTEGYDLPDLDAVMLCRPTQSISLLTQMIGRALRPHTEKKYGYIIDCTDNIYNHYGDYRIADLSFEQYSVRETGNELKKGTKPKEKKRIKEKEHSFEIICSSGVGEKEKKINVSYKKAWSIYVKRCHEIKKCRSFKSKCRYSAIKLIPACLELAMLGGFHNIESKELSRSRFIHCCKIVGYKDYTINKMITQSRLDFLNARKEGKSSLSAIHQAAELLTLNMLSYRNNKKTINDSLN
jgi:superfamily II DNA or RNA helicase